MGLVGWLGRELLLAWCDDVGAAVLATNPLTLIVRRGLESVCKTFAARMEPIGFLRTKKMFWTRVHPHTVDVVHLHRDGSTYGAPNNANVSIRVHFAIRVLNDPFESVALNGR